MNALVEKRLGRRRALNIVKGVIEAYSFDEVIAAWQVVHEDGLHHELLDWQKGVMQNLVFGQVIEGEPKVIPGIPRFHPYGALKRIEK
jgi:hypothetical protein